MSEPLVLSLLVIGGGAIVHALGVRSPVGLAGLSLPVGAFAYVLLGLVLLVTGLPAYPVIALGLLLAVGLTTLLMSDAATPWPLVVFFAVLATGIYVASAVLVTFGTVTTSVDSFSYAAGAGLFAEHGSFADVRSRFILNRGFTVPYLHALAHLGGRDLMSSFTPLLAVSGFATMAWIAAQSWWRAAGKGGSLLLGSSVLAATVVALATMPASLFHAVYIHTHLVFAVAALLAVGMGWLAARSAPHRTVGIVACVLGVVALVPVRPDGTPFALLALIPVLTSPILAATLRAVILAAYGLVALAWNGFLTWYGVDLEGVWRDEPLAMAGLGGLCILLALLLWRLPRLWVPQGFAVYGALTGLWVALGVFALSEPDILLGTLEASWANLGGEGSWGRSALFLALLAVVASLRSAEKHDRLLWFPIAAFVPYWLLLPHLRGGPWRASPADSGNRIVYHVVLLVGLWVAAMVPRLREPKAFEHRESQTALEASRSDARS
jgi:hypothetical protein